MQPSSSSVDIHLSRSNAFFTTFFRFLQEAPAPKDYTYVTSVVILQRREIFSSGKFCINMLPGWTSLVYQLTDSENIFCNYRHDFIPIWNNTTSLSSLGKRQLLSLLWNTANFNRVCVGLLRNAMLMKEYTVGNFSEDQADWRASGKVWGNCISCFLAGLLTRKATLITGRPLARLFFYI